MKKILLLSLLLLFSISLVACNTKEKDISTEINNEDIDNDVVTEESDKALSSYTESWYRERMEEATYHYCGEKRFNYSNYQKERANIDQYLASGIEWINNYEALLTEIGESFDSVAKLVNMSGVDRCRSAILFCYIRNKGQMYTDFNVIRVFYKTNAPTTGEQDDIETLPEYKSPQFHGGVEVEHKFPLLYNMDIENINKIKDYIE